MIHLSMAAASSKAKLRPAFSMSRSYIQLVSAIQHLPTLFPMRAVSNEDGDSIIVTWQGTVQELCLALNKDRLSFYRILKQANKDGVMTHWVHYGNRSVTFACSKLIIFAEALG